MNTKQIFLTEKEKNGEKSIDLRKWLKKVKGKNINSGTNIYTTAALV